MSWHAAPFSTEVKKDCNCVFSTRIILMVHYVYCVEIVELNDKNAAKNEITKDALLTQGR